METTSAAIKLRRFDLMSVDKLFFAAFLYSKNVNFHHIKIKMFYIQYSAASNSEFFKQRSVLAKNGKEIK